MEKALPNKKQTRKKHSRQESYNYFLQHCCHKVSTGQQSIDTVLIPGDFVLYSLKIELIGLGNLQKLQSEP